MPLDTVTNANNDVITSPLAMLYKREQQTPNTHYMTQPLPGGDNRTYTWPDLVTVAFPYANTPGEHQYNEFIDVEPLDQNPVPDINNIMTIIYTSGSTGQPKGVVHSYASICWAAKNSLNALSTNDKDRMMSYLPLAHITERALVEFASFYSGMSLAFVESLETFNRDVKNCQPTLFISVPRLWTKFQMGVLAKVPQKKLKLTK